VDAQDASVPWRLLSLHSPDGPCSSSRRNRSRITNGSELLRGVDGRSAEGRRYRDLTEAFRTEFGLRSSEREMAAIRLAAALTTRSPTA
jgi:hypothetical protein